MTHFAWIGGSGNYTDATHWRPPGGADDAATIAQGGALATCSGALRSFLVCNTADGSLLTENTATLQLQVNTQIKVGNDAGAIGNLAIESEASLIDQAGTGGDIVGFTLGANGMVSVDGAGSDWSTNGRIIIGLDGATTLLMRDGA